MKFLGTMLDFLSILVQMHFQEFKRCLSSRIGSAQKPGVFRLTRISRFYGERESLHFSPTSGPANERADALMRDLLDEADHDDRLVSDHGDLGGDISPPATLGDLCEQESFSSPNPGPGNGRADASMMVDMAPSSRLSRGEGMQESGPCSFRLSANSAYSNGASTRCVTIGDS